jgi:UDP-N-acetylglucosamine--N-acetylmuramyl-(pentapeptide) pyrophosphoryl-undecaprenol N-acetylglucosamine transferase
MAHTIRIVLTGGGSGGHVYPLLAVADEIVREANREGIPVSLTYIGPRDRYDAEFAAAHIKTRAIPGAKWRRYTSFQNILDIPRFFVSVVMALWRVYFIMPDAIFSKGGPGAFPVVFAGWFYRVPVMIHDSDSIPGVTNLLSARFAMRIAIGFSRAATAFPPRKTALVGLPIRRSLLENIPDQASAKSTLGFLPEAPLILVIGGSQGSQRLNELIVTNLPAILELGQVLHQVGPDNFKEMNELSSAATRSLPSEMAAKERYKAVAFFTDDLKQALAAADLVISRAGSSVYEIAAFGKPMILIPLKESGRDHQRANAYECQRAGTAIVIEEQNLLPGIFVRTLKSLIENKETLAKMSESSKKFFIPDAARNIAREVLILAKTGS